MNANNALKYFRERDIEYIGFKFNLKNFEKTKNILQL